MTNQPKWKVISSTDYSRTLEDETGVYPPELEIAQEYEDEKGKTKFMLHRFPLDKLKLVPKGDRAYLVPDSYNESYSHPLETYEEWFVKDLKRVAESVGAEEMELIDALTSDKTMDRAYAYESIANYHGLNNFDDYPQDLTEKQLNKRWK